MAKGGAFERHICKTLSLWWTDGARDDVFWRSSQSGGRATQRWKTGRKTAGSYGDIAAVDPIGAPLLQLFTIELKTGKSHGSVSDLLEWNSRGVCPCPFEQTLIQAYDAHVLAESLGWMVISRRLGKLPVVYADVYTLKQLESGTRLLEPSCAHYRIVTRRGIYLRFLAVGLEQFLDRLDPRDVKKLAKNTGG